MSRVFPLTLTLTLSPNTKDGDGGPELGEREQMMGPLTQGGTSRDSGPELLPLVQPWATV